MEQLMEEKLKAWEKPHVAKVKCSNPRALIPMTLEVFTFTTPKAQVEE